MANQLGQQVAIKWNGKLLLGKLTAGFSGSTAVVDVTNDNSAGFKESLPGDISGTASFSAVYDPAAVTGQGCEDLRADWLSKAIHPLIFGGTTTGDHITTVTAYITKFTDTGKHGDKRTCDVTWEVTGSIAVGTAV